MVASELGIRFGTAAVPGPQNCLKEIALWSATLEKWGFDLLGVADSPSIYPELFSALAVVAEGNFVSAGSYLGDQPCLAPSSGSGKRTSLGPGIWRRPDHSRCRNRRWRTRKRWSAARHALRNRQAS